MMQGEASDLFIRKFSFWDHLSGKEKEALCTHTHWQHYKKGATLYHDGEDCLGVLLVKKGQLRVYTLSEDGRDITLYRIFPGNVGILSASCALRSVTFEVFMEAQEDTEVLVTDPGFFQTLTVQNIYVKCFGYELAASRLSEMLWRMQQILFMSADRRLALFLLQEAAQTKQDVLPLTHEEIASYMGSAREVVSRLLKYFSQEGLVQVSRGRVEILDVRRLRVVAGKE